MLIYWDFKKIFRLSGFYITKQSVQKSVTKTLTKAWYVLLRITWRLSEPLVKIYFAQSSLSTYWNKLYKKIPNAVTHCKKPDSFCSEKLKKYHRSAFWDPMKLIQAWYYVPIYIVKKISVTTTLPVNHSAKMEWGITAESA